MLYDLPYEYEDETSIDWSLICSICSNPYSEPIITSCKHIFCYDCIELWLDKNPSCPICREYIREENYFWLTNESILNQLDQLLVKCLLCDKKSIIRLDINDHLAHYCSSVNESSKQKTRLKSKEQPDEHRARTTRQPSLNMSLEHRIRLYPSKSQIILRGLNITDLDMHLVIKLAVREKRCESLDIGNNPIGYNGLSFIADCLRNNQTLKSLSLHGIPISEYGISNLVATLNLNNCILNELDLDITQFNDSLVKYLVDMLKHNTQLKKLRLSCNRISKTGVKMLTSVLIRHNRTLKSLILSNNTLIKDSSVKYFINLIKKSSTLIELDLKDCSISEKKRNTLYQTPPRRINFHLNM